MTRLKKALPYFIIIGAALVCALNYQLFVFPNKFAPAGLNGICTMIQYLFEIRFGYLSLVINIPLGLWAARKIGRDLVVRSLLYVTSFSVFLILLDKLDLSRFIYETETGTSTILGPLVAGIITGACYSFLVRCNSSGGGTDFIAAVIHRSRPELNFFWITFSLNVLVALSSYFVYGFQMEPVILCILYCFMSSTVSDKVLKSGRTAIRCEIITEYPDEISQQIISRLHHGATLVPAKGIYAGKETNLLLCVVNNAQLPVLTEIVKSYPHTFAVFSGATEVVGNFKRLDANGKPEKSLLSVENQTLL